MVKLIWENVFKAIIAFTISTAIFVVLTIYFELSGEVGFLNGIAWGSITMNVIMLKWDLFYYEKLENLNNNSNKKGE